jgi:hypothetical protein
MNLEQLGERRTLNPDMIASSNRESGLEREPFPTIAFLNGSHCIMQQLGIP